MDKKRRENIKMLALVGFILTSIALIISIWAGGILENEFTNPSFYRSTMQAVEVTETPTPTPTLAPGDAAGSELEENGPTLTPTPTIDWVAIEDDQ